MHLFSSYNEVFAKKKKKRSTHTLPARAAGLLEPVLARAATATTARRTTPATICILRRALSEDLRSTGGRRGRGTCVNRSVDHGDCLHDQGPYYPAQATQGAGLIRHRVGWPLCGAGAERCLDRCLPSRSARRPRCGPPALAVLPACSTYPYAAAAAAKAGPVGTAAAAVQLRTSGAAPPAPADAWPPHSLPRDEPHVRPWPGSLRPGLAPYWPPHAR
jgi:hypothetical protein